MTDKELFTQLESMLDATSAERLLNTLAGVCLAKECHIRENWQGGALAAKWQYLARKASALGDIAAEASL